MKFTVSRRIFLAALKPLVKVTKKTYVKPITKCVFLEIEAVETDKKIKIVGTDLDMSIINYCEIIDGENGYIAVDYKLLYGYISSSISNEIHVEIAGTVTDSNGEEKTKIKVSDDDSHIILILSDAEMFPSVTCPKLIEKITMDASELYKILLYGGFSYALEEKKYAIHGIHMELKNNSLCVATTDGHRLAMSQIDLKDDCKEFKCILPVSYVDAVLQLIKNTNAADVATIGLYGNSAAVIYNNSVIMSQLVEGNFPPFDKVIPQGQQKNTVSIDSELLVRTLNRALQFTSELKETIQITFTNGEIIVESRNNGAGFGTYSCPAVYDCEENTILNLFPNFLIDFIRIVGSECKMFSFGFNEVNRPILIKYDCITYVIMPTRPW